MLRCRVIWRGGSNSDNIPYEKIGDEVRSLSDEVPFDIPDSWEWVRLGSISSYAETKQKVNATIANPSAWGLDLEDIEKGGRLLEHKTVGERKAVGDKTVFSKGDILYSKLRPYLLKILVAPDDGICTPEIVPFRVYGGINPYYIVNYLQSPYIDNLINSITYGVKMPRVGTKTMISLLVPIPPLEEQQRIVDKIDAVASAVSAYDVAYQKNESLSSAFPEALKKSILQEAVQGKLVPQDPSDEPAEALLERIRAEKQRLIKEKKIKKDKHESIIFRRDNSHYEKLDGMERCIDDEIPFDIPDAWTFVRLQSICKKITDGEHKTPKRVTDYCGFFLLSARNVRDGYISLNDVDYVDETEYLNISKRCSPVKDDILISCSGSVGRCCIVDDDNNYVMVRSAAMISPIQCNSKYIMYAIQSPMVQKQISEKIKQAVQANLFQGAIRELLIPVPTLEEQFRIVNQIETILPALKNLH